MERYTKIIATLGPASGDPQTIIRLVSAGMDVARLNFSHGDYATHARYAEWVRQAAENAGRAVAVLQDIQGPRIRIGTFPGGSIEVETDQRLVLLDGDAEAAPGEVYVQHLANASLDKGDRVLLSDGHVELEIVGPAARGLEAVVVQGGMLRDRKGAAFPGVQLGLPAITEKDRADLEFGAEIGVDMVAASFVTSADDMNEVRSLTDDIPIIAKVERATAYQNLDDILSAADGAMVARGDLGVELGFEPMPRAQKDIITRTNAAGAISITATEMLESMTSSPRPTRAEVTDVANAVLDGTDAVMLSAETAAGQYPVRAVEVMSAICKEAEAGPRFEAGLHTDFVHGGNRIASAIAQSSADTANSLDLKVIVAFTESGGTARLVSKYRPAARIFALTPEKRTYHQMAILWGVTPAMFPRCTSTDEMINSADALVRETGLVEDGEWFVLTAGIPPNQRASTNLLKLHQVGSSVDGSHFVAG